MVHMIDTTILGMFWGKGWSHSFWWNAPDLSTISLTSSKMRAAGGIVTRNEKDHHGLTANETKTEQKGNHSHSLSLTALQKEIEAQSTREH